MRRRAQAFLLRRELENQEGRQRRQHHHAQDGVADKRPPQEKIAEPRQRVGARRCPPQKCRWPANPSCHRRQTPCGWRSTRRSCSHRSRPSSAAARPANFASKNCARPTGLDRTASAVPLRISRASDADALNTAPNRPDSSITASTELFHQLRLVAEREVIGHRQKNLKQHGTRHQQQKNRLPDEFHEGVDRNVPKLSHALL